MLISPNFPALEDWARANQIDFASRDALVANAKVQALYESIIEELNQNLALRKNETRTGSAGRILGSRWNPDAHHEGTATGD